MVTRVRDIESFIATELHSLLFLEEFVFAKNRFTPPAGSELELADAVVMLGDVLLIYQIKERNLEKAGDAESERRWFRDAVLKQAVRQIKDTLGYLRTYQEIEVPNERGRRFNLASSCFAEIIKIIVYLPAPNLPADCRAIRHYVSQTAGLIHIIDASDYVQVSRLLRVPEEVIRYFKHREMVLTRFRETCSDLPEPAIAGDYIGGTEGGIPTPESALHLRNLVDDEEEWNLAPFLRTLHDNFSVDDYNDDYYPIMLEFAKLPRSAWREVKRRILLCLEKVGKREFAKPYRMTDPTTGCGFVFVPVPPEISGDPEWANMRAQAIRNFAEAHKYDQRLSKCIGFMVRKDGEYFEIVWSLIAHDWCEDPEFQKRLNENFPLRPVQDAEIHGYHFIEDTPSAQ
jgi:hypothetical protein